MEELGIAFRAWEYCGKSLSAGQVIKGVRRSVAVGGGVNLRDRFGQPRKWGTGLWEKLGMGFQA